MKKPTGRKQGGQPKPPLDDVKLRELYIDRGMDGGSVAHEMGVCQQRVYKRLKELGIMRTSGPKNLIAELNPNWRGGRHVSADGYVCCRRNNCRDYEHRIVAKKMLGRDLMDGEVVHHINGDATDNRPENLEVLPSHSAHMRRHISPERARQMQKKAAAKRREKLTPKQIAAMRVVESAGGICRVADIRDSIGEGERAYKRASSLVQKMIDRGVVKKIERGTVKLTAKGERFLKEGGNEEA